MDLIDRILSGESSDPRVLEFQRLYQLQVEAYLPVSNLCPGPTTRIATQQELDKANARAEGELYTFDNYLIADPHPLDIRAMDRLAEAKRHIAELLGLVEPEPVSKVELA
ncbi:hypothetical protein KDX38_10975 [Pseudomonas sp. CDFA 602]|uniref:hypothetical protein n=1 Tax=Pseudomonas californiensis TaxID=2829823 RepID=UPI001E3BEA3C|nr:hypothetical protein [Pseudomonas californiensis]MCD5994160.1 hypothetical protein [Pseudomonas californiensis]MCD5999741.1 hypothetical protein [Pseudomonas californiensis]